MSWHRPLAVALALLLGAPALAQTPGTRAAFGPPPQAPAAGIEQRLNAPLPLDLPLRDAHGQDLRLRQLFEPGRPVLLVPGYYRCPNLCGLLMHGLLEALQQTGLPPQRYRLIGVSLDPQDTPATASARERAYAQYAAFLGRDGGAAPAAPQLLLASADAGRALARRIGYDFRQVPDDGGYAHPAGFIVATPDGRVSRYLMGVRFEPRALRLALVDASSGRIGGLADRIALLCAHLDLQRGRYSALVMDAVRAAAVLLVLALAGYAWRHRDGRLAKRRDA